MRVSRTERINQRRLAVFGDLETLTEHYEAVEEEVSVEQVVFGPDGEIAIIYINLGVE